MFSDIELKFLAEQTLARIGTVSSTGQPDVAPVGFEFDGEYFYVGGMHMLTTRKYKNVRAGRRKVALAFDDLASAGPWKPRGIRVHGTGDIVEREGRFGRAKYIRVRPRISWSWGLEGLPMEQGQVMHKTVHGSPGGNPDPKSLS